MTEGTRTLVDPSAPVEIIDAPSLELLLADEFELRAALLRDARIDDGEMIGPQGIPGYREIPVGGHALSDVAAGDYWPLFCALAELRIVEREIHQIQEVLRG